MIFERITYRTRYMYTYSSRTYCLGKLSRNVHISRFPDSYPSPLKNKVTFRCSNVQRFLHSTGQHWVLYKSQQKIETLGRVVQFSLLHEALNLIPADLVKSTKPCNACPKGFHTYNDFPYPNQRVVLPWKITTYLWNPPKVQIQIVMLYETAAV